MKLLDDFLRKNNYDVRKSNDARFMDQKCTPDVIYIIADCVLNLREADSGIEFTVKDIWDSQYFIKNVKAIFNKPLASNPTTKSEYDKFIQQPLRLLAYAGVLSVEKRGVTNFYTIVEPQILEYIALKDRNAYIFLYKYITKVLDDCGLLKYFELYKSKYEDNSLSSNDFQYLQNKFISFIRGNTLINGELEIKRIYPKILNIYACENNLPGSVKGKLSKNQFYYTDLMYNRKNWRDLKKDKAISRQEKNNLNGAANQNNVAYQEYQIQKAMNLIKKIQIESEVKDQWSNGDATQVHHIFPKSKFPQLSHYFENLIKLTPTQHFTKAHPNNKTDAINIDYQLICLLAKCNTIEASLQKSIESPYRKESFIYCINTGLAIELKYNLNFNQIKQELVSAYNN